MKSYTDLSTSKLLMQILDPNTADYCWGINSDAENYNNTPYPLPWSGYTARKYYVPCWSLTGLLSLLDHPRIFQGDEPHYWFCGCYGKDGFYHEQESDNPVDVCVLMILDLHKNNIL